MRSRRMPSYLAWWIKPINKIQTRSMQAITQMNKSLCLSAFCLSSLMAMFASPSLKVCKRALPEGFHKARAILSVNVSAQHDG